MGKGEKPRGKRRKEKERGGELGEEEGAVEMRAIEEATIWGKRNKEGVNHEEQRSSLHSKSPGNSGQ